MLGQFDLGKVAFPYGLDEAVFANVGLVCSATATRGRDARVGIVVCALWPAANSETCWKGTNLLQTLHVYMKTNAFKADLWPYRVLDDDNWLRFTATEKKINIKWYCALPTLLEMWFLPFYYFSIILEPPSLRWFSRTGFTVITSLAHFHHFFCT